MSSVADKLRAFDPGLPLERAHTIPSSWYFDREIAELEKERVFGGTWQAVGRADQVSESGRFFTADVAGQPILVVRDEHGTLRAFHNVCRHRAARVAHEPEGKVSKLRCRYHGWTYDLAGCLRGTPEFEGVCDFPKEHNGLIPLAVETWGPFVFVYAEANPPPLADFLAPLPERSAPFQPASLKFAGRRSYDLACNWKVYVDNFLDGGYHVHTVHPGLASVLDYANYRAETFAFTSVQNSPLKVDDSGDLAKVRAGTSAQYWYVFPNFMVNLYQGVMDTNLVLPLEEGRCRVIFDFYFADTESDAGRAFVSRSIAVAEQIQQEDIGICEDVQHGLRSNRFDTGRFSVRRENAGYHFHQLLARRLTQG